jgi:hypothetical protein
MSPVGFEPTIPASKLPQTHDLEHKAAGIGLLNIILNLILKKIVPFVTLLGMKQDTKCLLACSTDVNGTHICNYILLEHQILESNKAEGCLCVGDHPLSSSAIE